MARKPKADKYSPQNFYKAYTKRGGTSDFETFEKQFEIFGRVIIPVYCGFDDTGKSREEAVTEFCKEAGITDTEFNILFRAIDSVASVS